VSKDYSFPETKGLTKREAANKNRNLEFKAQIKVSKDSSLPRTRTRNKYMPLRRPNTSRSKAGRQKTPPSFG